EMANLDLLQPVCKKLGKRATLHLLDTADHGFRILKRSRKSDEDVFVEMARIVREWAGGGRLVKWTSLWFTGGDEESDTHTRLALRRRRDEPSGSGRRRGDSVLRKSVRLPRRITAGSAA